MFFWKRTERSCINEIKNKPSFIQNLPEDTVYNTLQYVGQKEKMCILPLVNKELGKKCRDGRAWYTFSVTTNIVPVTKLLTQVRVNRITLVQKEMEESYVRRCLHLCGDEVQVVRVKNSLQQGHGGVLFAESKTDPIAWSQVRSLNLKGCTHLSDVAFLKFIPSLSSQLIHIDLSFCKFLTTSTLTELCVQKGSTLKRLSLSGCRVDDELLRTIAKRAPGLEHLSLETCQQVSDWGLGFLRKLSALEYLNIHSCIRITDEGIQNLVQSVSWEDVYSRSSYSPLRRLILSGCAQLTDRSLIHLNNAPDIQFLYLHRCNRITSHGLSIFTRAHPKLQSLNLYYCSPTLTNDLFTQGMQSCSDLKDLNLTNCKSVNDTSLRFLGRYCRQLTTLNLYNTDITAEGLRFLAEGCPSLRSLNISLCFNLGNDALKHVADMKWLQALQCSMNPNVSEEGIRHLCSAHGPALTYLELFTCPLVDDAAVSLICGSDAPIRHSISHLTLSGNQQITNVSVARLANCRNLTSVVLSDCSVTAEAVKALGRRLPFWRPSGRVVGRHVSFRASRLWRLQHALAPYVPNRVQQQIAPYMPYLEQAVEYCTHSVHVSTHRLKLVWGSTAISLVMLLVALLIYWMI